MKFSPQFENPALTAATIPFRAPRAVYQARAASSSNSPGQASSKRRSLFGDPCSRIGGSIFSQSWLCTLFVALLGLQISLPAHAQTATFDFDSGTPAPTPGKTTPFNYDSGGVTATFSSTTANGFSVQDVNSVPGAGTLSLFSGQFLNPNSTQRSTLRIKFSQAATNLSLVFATAQSTAVEIPNPITLSAYLDSTTNRVGSPLTVSGVWRVGSVTEAYPSAALTFSSDPQHPFNLIEIVMAPGGAGGVMVDNVSIQTAAIPAEPTLQSSGTVGGSFTDDLTATVDGTQRTMTVPVKPARQFYRLRSNTTTQITQIQVVGSQVILRYQ